MMMFRRNEELFTDEENLRQLAAPWRTRVHLDRLQAAARKPGEAFEFAVLGDAEPGRFWIWRALFNRPGVFRRQLSRVQTQSVDFTIQLGDMVSCGKPRHYFDFFRQLHGLPIEKPYLTVIGNHDRSHPHGRSHSRVYRRLFGRATNYFFDYGGVRFIVLDSSRQRLTQAQIRWLAAVCRGPRRKVVLTHMPPVLLGLWGPAGHRMGGFHQGAHQFTDLMAELAVERVYMGHVHAFGVQDYKGVRYVLTGGGGSPLFPSGARDRFHHFLTVSVGPDGLRERVHLLDGSSFQIPAGKVLIA